MLMTAGDHLSMHLLRLVLILRGGGVEYQVVTRVAASVTAPPVSQQHTCSVPETNSHVSARPIAVLGSYCPSGGVIRRSPALGTGRLFPAAGPGIARPVRARVHPGPSHVGLLYRLPSPGMALLPADFPRRFVEPRSR